jgi:hypothetical protein
MLCSPTTCTTGCWCCPSATRRWSPACRARRRERGSAWCLPPTRGDRGPPVREALSPAGRPKRRSRAERGGLQPDRSLIHLRVDSQRQVAAHTPPGKWGPPLIITSSQPCKVLLAVRRRGTPRAPPALGTLPGHGTDLHAGPHRPRGWGMQKWLNRRTRVKAKAMSDKSISYLPRNHESRPSSAGTATRQAATASSIFCSSMISSPLATASGRFCVGSVTSGRSPPRTAASTRSR